MYDPISNKPFRLSRSKLDSFLNCPRCFYLDRRLGIGQPPGYPFNLNSAVDTLLKKEFDHYRKLGKPHPLMEENYIKAIPFKHEKLDEWRDSLSRGIQFLHPKTNLLITGGVDDVWISHSEELIIVDYKATSKNGRVSLDAEWQIGYKRQMEIYQWLFRMNDFQVSDTGYFVYCNGITNCERFGKRLEFDVNVLPYKGNTLWIEDTIINAHKCLTSKSIPPKSDGCDFCQYTSALADIEKS